MCPQRPITSLHRRGALLGGGDKSKEGNICEVWQVPGNRFEVHIDCDVIEVWGSDGVVCEAAIDTAVLGLCVLNLQGLVRYAQLSVWQHIATDAHLVASKIENKKWTLPENQIKDVISAHLQHIISERQRLRGFSSAVNCHRSCETKGITLSYGKKNALERDRLPMLCLERDNRLRHTAVWCLLPRLVTLCGTSAPALWTVALEKMHRFPFVCEWFCRENWTYNGAHVIPKKNTQNLAIYT